MNLIEVFNALYAIATEEDKKMWHSQNDFENKDELKNKYTQTVAKWQVRAERAEKGEAEEINKRFTIEAHLISLIAAINRLMTSLSSLPDNLLYTMVYTGDIRALSEAVERILNEDANAILKERNKARNK